MISITPQGQIYLCKTPLENDYKNQLTFNNASAQLNYFTSKIYKTLSEYTYIKHDNIIKVGYNIDEIISCNYLFYKNTGFTNKYYFCFITNMEYINENCTSISFETDVFQTYQFDIVYNQCFIEREHVEDDTVGLHTVPENLETGEYVVNYENKNTQFNTLSVIMASNVDTSLDENNELVGGAVFGGTYNKIKQGYKYYYFSNTSTSSLNTVLKAIDDAGKSDSVNYLFLAPFNSFVRDDTTVIDNGKVKEDYTVKIVDWENVITGDTAPTKLTTLNGYTPKNNKLLTFPYCYLRVTNNNGNDAIFHFEKFANNIANKCYFQFMCTICPGMSINLYPLSYDNITNNYNECLPAGKFPICGYSSDVYTNWLTQNGVNIISSTIGNALQIAVGTVAALTGAGLPGATMVANGIGGIKNTLTTIYEHSFNPIQSRGATNTGDVKTSADINTFTAYGMSIKQEFAKIIDRYFDMFGYQVNEVKTPNIKSRTYWNYIKTIDCNFDGDIPQPYLDKIKSIFNTGITFWHDASKIYDYSQTNSIVNNVVNNES